MIRYLALTMIVGCGATNSHEEQPRFQPVLSSVFAHVPAPKGFWCVDVKAPKARPVGLCYRTKKQCQAMKGDFELEGSRTTACSRSDVAFCFLASKPTKMLTGEACFFEMKVCKALRAQARKKDPEGLFGECKRTT